MSPEELNELLAKNRDQKFRKRTERQLEGSEKRIVTSLVSAKIRNDDPTYQANRQAMFNSEEWKKNHDKAAEKNSQNPKWRESQKKAGPNRSKENEEWYNSFLEGNQKAVEEKHQNGTYEVWKDKMDSWRQTPEGQEHLVKKSILTREMGKKNSRAVQTLNDGEFPSVRIAAEFYKIGTASMSQRIKDHNDLYWFKDLGPGISKRKKINI
jgi:hypothetical protein